MLAEYPLVTVLPCVDLARARKFYGETLGLTEIPLPTPAGIDPPPNVGAMFQSAQGTRLFAYVRETPSTADHTVAGWLVGEFDAVVDGLLERGVHFEVYADMPDTAWDERGVATSPSGSRGAWFKDPDGNILSLTEMPR